MFYSWCWLLGILVLVSLSFVGCSTQLTKPAGVLFKVDDDTTTARDGFGLMNEFAMARMVGENANVKRFTTNVALGVVKRGLTIPVPGEADA